MTETTKKGAKRKAKTATAKTDPRRAKFDAMMKEFSAAVWALEECRARAWDMIDLLDVNPDKCEQVQELLYGIERARTELYNVVEIGM